MHTRTYQINKMTCLPIRSAVVLPVLTIIIAIVTTIISLSSISAQDWQPGNKAGDRLVKSLNGVEYAFRWIPPGKFVLYGKPTSITEQRKETKVDVTFTYGVWLLETEVTQKMWSSVMGSQPSFYQGDDRPVEKVTWKEVQKFCRKASDQWQVEIALPTNALWEYACLTGRDWKEILSPKNKKRPGGSDTSNEGSQRNSAAPFWNTKGNGQRVGAVSYWGAVNSKGETHDVGKTIPNSWGLYDMMGNVWEMCSDYYGELPLRSVSDPTGPRRGFTHVIRGGSYSDFQSLLTLFHRSEISPSLGRRDVGFRVIAIPNQETELLYFGSSDN